MRKSFWAGLLCLGMLLTFVPLTVSAADATGYVTVNNDTENQYETLDEAVAAATVGEDKTVTYHIYGAVTATGTSEKYTPDLALNGAATTVNVIGEDASATITLSGVYYQRLAAEGAVLNVQNVTMDDDKKSSGEGRDKDPWEFTYIQPECASVSFTNCTFKEGILVSVDATFDGCTFTMVPEYYSDLNDGVDYSGDHYQLWIHNYGNVVVENCTFKEATYGAIKSTWNKYGTNSNLTLSVTKSTFEDITNKVPVNLDGAVEVVFTGNSLKNCKQNEGSFVKSDIEITLTENNNTIVCEHDLTFIPPVDATCQATGTGEYWTCANCNKMFSDSEGTSVITEVPVVAQLTTHTYQEGKCTVTGCTAEDPDYNTTTDVEMKVDETTTSEAAAEAETAKTVITGGSTEGKVELTVSDAVINDVKEKLSSSTNTVTIVTEVVAQTVTEDEIKDSAQDDAAKIEEAAAEIGANVAQYLDLAVLVKAVEAQGTSSEKVTTLGELTETKNEITFTISVPEALRAENIIVTVVRVHDNGDVEELATTKNSDGTYSFKTNKFSTYAVTYKSTTLPEADENGIIKLTENVALAGTVTITKDTIIDLNGYIIKGEKATNFHVTNGTLKVIDSSADSTGAINVTGEAFRVGVKDATKDTVALIIESGVDVTSSDDACVVIYDGTLTTSGNLTSSGTYATITGSGSGGDNTVININGGTVTHNSDVAIYHPQVGTLTVNDGAIGGATGIEMRAGTLTVNGGTITATEEFVAPSQNGNGSTVTGAAVAVSQHTTNNPISVTIAGGRLTGAKALYEADLEDNTTEGVTMSAIGGTFDGAVESENVTEFVSGGTFTTEVQAEFCAENFAPQKNEDGTYGVHVHILTAVAAKDADCTSNGNIAYWYCANCGKHYSDAAGTKEISADSVKIPALGHDEVSHGNYDATCTASGREDGTKCGRCGMIMTEPVKVPALGHSFVNGTCTTCGISEKTVAASSPATGDTSNMFVWITLMVVCCGVVLGTTVYRKNK